MSELTDADAEKIAVRVVQKFKEGHECYLHIGERKMVHGIHDIMLEERADLGTWRCVIQLGMGFQNSIKRITTGVTIGVMVVLLSFVGAKGLPWLIKFMGGK